ncbi:MAG: hypothetical protein ABSG78_18785 [Verrucomicrobiota bacterium]|jgi:hypothetical protein
MSNPADNPSEEFSSVREQFALYHRILTDCRLMLAKDIDEYVGKKRAQALRQKYGTDRINDHFASLQNAHWKVFCKEPDLGGKFAHLSPAVKEKALEFCCISLATHMVRQIRRFHDCGMVDALNKGDESGLVLALMRFKGTREYPGFQDRQKRLIDWALKRNRDDVLLKLGKVLNRPPLDYAGVGRDPIKAFLLAWWDRPGTDANGKLIPPLCYFTDDALASLMVDQFQQRGLLSDTIRKKWERLGLLKVRKPPVVRAGLRPLK